jgi:ferredoxin-NADP reductase
MAMLRHRRRAMPETEMRLVYSVRTAEDVIYADELGGDAVLTYTREPPAGWSGHTGRIDAALIADAARGAMTAYVCGSHGFVEAAADLLLDAGLQPEGIRTERFGPTGLG